MMLKTLNRLAVVKLSDIKSILQTSLGWTGCAKGDLTRAGSLLRLFLRIISPSNLNPQNTFSVPYKALFAYAVIIVVKTTVRFDLAHFDELVNDLGVVFSRLVIPHRPTQADYLTGSLNTQTLIFYSRLSKLFALTGL
jgi:hypothetical protein